MTVLEETALAATPRREEGPTPYARSPKVPDPSRTPTPSYRTLGLATEAVPAMVSMHRTACAFVFARWGLESVADNALLVVSELVTNTVVHGDGNVVSLGMTYAANKLHIVVGDGTPARPVLQKPGPDDERGRGLILVKELADTWGTSDDGTCTYATITVPKNGHR
ncbi:ATP-binding protein [Streptomyces sp. NPDC057654]|uniref:ATP-binding protein n=1 Tax=Streptomyces sp. NPDC057654 TaxID=3346196 RepID=UPI0036985D38